MAGGGMVGRPVFSIPYCSKASPAPTIRKPRKSNLGGLVPRISSTKRKASRMPRQPKGMLI